MFTALADRYGDLSNKLNLFVALAPAVYIHDSADKWMKDLAGALDDSLTYLLHSFGIYELLGDEWDAIRDPFCEIFHDFCNMVGIIKIIGGPNVDAEAAVFSNIRPHSSLSVK